MGQAAGMHLQERATSLSSRHRSMSPCRWLGRRHFGTLAAVPEWASDLQQALSGYMPSACMIGALQHWLRGLLLMPRRLS